MYDSDKRIRTNLWQHSAWDNERFPNVNEVIRNEDIGYILTKIKAPCSRVARLVGGMCIYNAIYKVARHLYNTTIIKNGDITTRVVEKYPRGFYKIDKVVIFSSPESVTIQTYAPNAEEAEAKAIAEVVKRLQPCTNSK